MKMNKLVIAMGLATATIVGCGSSEPENVNAITAIDGYIVLGNVALDCGTKTFTGKTNASGIVKFDIQRLNFADCRVEIKGDENSYDHDKGQGVAWLHTMRSLPGARIINPYTDIAAILADDPANAGKSNAELMAAVITTLGPDAVNIVGDFDLFSDFGSNSNSSLASQKVRVLAESTFATIIKSIASLGAKDSVANRLAVFKTVLPAVTTAVEAKILEAGDSLAGVVFTVEVDIPTLVINEDGSVDTDALETALPPVVIVTVVKPPVPGATPTPVITGTGGDSQNQG